MTARAIAASMCLLLSLPCLGKAQGLGDAAARERQKRANPASKKNQDSKKDVPVKVITNEDLDRLKPVGGDGTAAVPPAGTIGEDVAPSPVVDRNTDLRPFIEAVASAQSRTASIEARIRELGGKLNPMSTTFIYGAYGSNSANEEAQVREALTQSEAELSGARQALAAANRSLEDARRGSASSPPAQN